MTLWNKLKLYCGFVLKRVFIISVEEIYNEILWNGVIFLYNEIMYLIKNLIGLIN